MYVYIQMYKYLYVYVYMYIYIYIYMYVYMCIIGKYTYIYIYTCINETLFLDLSHTQPPTSDTRTQARKHKQNSKSSSIHPHIQTHANRQPRTRHQKNAHTYVRTHSDTHNSHASPIVSILVRFRCVTHLSKSENKLLIVSAKSVLQCDTHICIDTTYK